MWLFPLFTLGVVSVLTFMQGFITTLAVGTSSGPHAESWLSLGLMAAGVAGMWWTVRLTPER